MNEYRLFGQMNFHLNISIRSMSYHFCLSDKPATCLPKVPEVTAILLLPHRTDDACVIQQPPERTSPQ